MIRAVAFCPKCKSPLCAGECVIENIKNIENQVTENITNLFKKTVEQKTLRDEFAMSAIGILTKVSEPTEENIAKFAYRIADAMLEARKIETKGE